MQACPPPDVASRLEERTGLVPAELGSYGDRDLDLVLPSEGEVEAGLYRMVGPDRATEDFHLFSIGD